MKSFLILIMLLLTSCSHSLITKQCKEVKDDEKFVCKTIKPWE